MSVPLLLRYTDFLLNASRLLRLDSAQGFVCWLLIAPWYSGPCASVSHCCSTGTSVFDRACIRRQLLDHLHPLLFSQICVSCSVTLGCFVDSCLLLAVLLFHGFLGPNPWLFVNGFSGPNPWLFYFLHNPGCACFIQPNLMISMPFSPSNHCCSLHGTSSIFTSRASRTHRLLVTIEVAIFTHNSVDVQSLLHLLSRELHHVVSTTRSTSRLLHTTIVV